VSYDVVRYDRGVHYLTSTAAADGITPSVVIVPPVIFWRVRG
jgi:hypothetical protein